MPRQRSRVLIWCGVLAAALAELASSRRELIVGGEEATPHDYSFVLSLQAWGSHTCGASLVSPDWALTAAHCAQSEVSAYSVSVHRHDLSVHSSADHDCAEDIAVAEKFCHAGYSKVSMHADICLLRLQRAATCANGIAIPTLDDGSATQVGQSYTVAGWGKTAHLYEGSYDPELLPDRLQHTQVQLQSESTCDALLGDIDDGMLCAGNLAGGED